MDDTGTLRIEDLLTHQAWVRSLARALVSSPDRAGDVEQETWVAVVTPQILPLFGPEKAQESAG